MFNKGALRKKGAFFMCRVLGAIGNGDISDIVQLGIQMQIYAGEFSSGIASLNETGIVVRKARGKATEVFTHIDPELKGNLAIGHNGCGFGQIQPELITVAGETVALATDSSARSSQNIIKILRNSADIITGIKEAMVKVRKPFALVVISPQKGLIAARNSGIKPLTIGQFHDGGPSGYYVASQSGVVLNGEFVDVVKAGNIDLIGPEGYEEIAVLPRPYRSHCVNEALFRQRPDNRCGSRNVYDIRLDIGRSLGIKFRTKYASTHRSYKAIPILEGGRTFTIGFGETVGNFVHTDPAGSIRNIYSVPPAMKQTARSIGLSENFSLGPLPNIEGKRVILIDDQLRSGHKIKHMAQQCFKCGAKEVLAVVGSIGYHSCPFGDPAYVGKDLIAEHYKHEEIQRFLGVSDLITLTIEELVESINTPDRIHCLKCVSPTPVI